MPTIIASRIIGKSVPDDADLAFKLPGECSNHRELTEIPNITGVTVLHFIILPPSSKGTHNRGQFLQRCTNRTLEWFQHFVESGLGILRGERAYDCIVDLGETDMLLRARKSLVEYRGSPEHAEQAKQLQHLQIGADSECWDFICEGFEVFGDL